MQKISITIDLSKINKDKIVTRTYTNKDGQEVTVKDYKMDVIEGKEAKVIKTGATWELVKTHFVAESPTKEEREAKTKTPILGDGVQFRDLQQSAEEMNQDVEYPEEYINPDDEPF